MKNKIQLIKILFKNYNNNQDNIFEFNSNEKFSFNYFNKNFNKIENKLIINNNKIKN